MPAGRDFIDAQAKVGKKYPRVPRNAASFSADSTSRSLSLASRDQKLSRKLQALVRDDNYLIIDTSQIINDQKIKISKTVAIQLARWILTQYERQDLLAQVLSEESDAGLQCELQVKPEVSNTQEANLVGESEGDGGIPSKPTETE